MMMMMMIIIIINQYNLIKQIIYQYHTFKKAYLNSSISPKFAFEDGKQNILTSLSSTSSYTIL